MLSNFAGSDTSGRPIAIASQYQLLNCSATKPLTQFLLTVAELNLL